MAIEGALPNNVAIRKSGKDILEMAAANVMTPEGRNGVILARNNAAHLFPLEA